MRFTKSNEGKYIVTVRFCKTLKTFSLLNVLRVYLLYCMDMKLGLTLQGKNID